MLLLTLNLTMPNPPAAVSAVGGAAVKLRPFTAGPQTVMPIAGEDDLALLVPADEPISAGAPPLRPGLVEEMTLTPAAVRRMHDSAGYTVSARMDNIPGAGGRARFKVRWKGMNKSERDSVIGFLRSVTQVGGTWRSFDVELDGPGLGVTRVRPIAAFRDTWAMMTGYSVEVDVEEVF